jgi:capsular polysaccharide transport system permease protein
MNESAPEVSRLGIKVKALEQQIDSERYKINQGNPKENALAGIFALYEPLLIEREFAEKAYASTLASLEAARMEANRKNRYLATFVVPTLPDETTEPHRVKAILTVFFGCCLSWAIGLLGIGIIREHIGWV